MCSGLHCRHSGPSFKHFQPTDLNGLILHSAGKGRISCCSFIFLKEIEYRCGYYTITTQLVAVEHEMLR